MRKWGILIALAVAGCGSTTTLLRSSTTKANLLSRSGGCHARSTGFPGGDLPDPRCTPGATDSRITQANIESTICKSGYTATVRPPVSYTNRLKVTQMRQYGYPDSNLHHFEEDHLISLELGGSPTDPRNLWPELGASPNPKDKIENRLHKEVCSGSISLHQAQQEIATNWTQVR